MSRHNAFRVESGRKRDRTQGMDQPFGVTTMVFASLADGAFAGWRVGYPLETDRTIHKPWQPQCPNHDSAGNEPTTSKVAGID